mgnify:CR=1 FL=1
MFLTKILNLKAQAVQDAKAAEPLERILKKIPGLPPTRSFQASLTGERINLIAEVKKASPSKGLLCPNFDPKRLAAIYEAAGASAISVLTDGPFFQGSLDDLRAVKAATNNTPVLRKDFMIDPYQLVEARLAGADAVLLIVAALTPLQLKELLNETIDLGMTPLVEVHDEPELDLALAAGAKIIGINNRNLKTFVVDLATSYRLAAKVPLEVLLVSESGIKDRSDILALEEAGFKAVLIGESIVTANDPGLKIKQLLGVA